MVFLDDITKALGDSCCMVYAFVFPSELGHTAVIKDFCTCNIQTIKRNFSDKNWEILCHQTVEA